MKKIIFVFAAALMMTAFVSCGQQTAAGDVNDSTAVDSALVIDSIDSVQVGDSVVADSLICND